MLLLLFSFITLCVGPLLFHTAARFGFGMKMLDSFVMVSVCGLVLLHVLPESISHGGTLAAVFALFGLLSPFVFSKLSKNSCRINNSLISLAFLGLMAHSILDGVALSHSSSNSVETSSALILAIAVIFHRLPEGVGIWKIIMNTGGKALAILTLGLTMTATSAGFFFGGHVLKHFSEDTLFSFQALMAGLLLHVLFHKHHNHSEKLIFRRKSKLDFGHALGGFLGILTIAGSLLLHPIYHADVHQHDSTHASHHGE